MFFFPTTARKSAKCPPETSSSCLLEAACPGAQRRMRRTKTRRLPFTSAMSTPATSTTSRASSLCTPLSRYDVQLDRNWTLLKQFQRHGDDPCLQHRNIEYFLDRPQNFVLSDTVASLILRVQALGCERGSVEDRNVLSHPWKFSFRIGMLSRDNLRFLIDGLCASEVLGTVSRAVYSGII